MTDKFKAKNYDEVFALGRKVYEIDPEFVQLFTVLASLGYDQGKLYGSKSKYNAETVFYAELAIKLLETSKLSVFYLTEICSKLKFLSVSIRVHLWTIFLPS